MSAHFSISFSLLSEQDVKANNKKLDNRMRVRIILLYIYSSDYLYPSSIQYTLKSFAKVVDEMKINEAKITIK